MRKSGARQPAVSVLLLLLLLLQPLRHAAAGIISHADPLHMAARHLPRVGGVVFQGVPDRGGISHQGSSAGLGGGGAGQVFGRDKSAGGGAKAGDSDGGGEIAEALGGGGAFSVEHELARMQGELTALLSCVNRRIRCEYEICVLFILFYCRYNQSPQPQTVQLQTGRIFAWRHMLEVRGGGRWLPVVVAWWLRW